MLEPGRELIREGPVAYITDSGPEKFYLYLFTDAVVLAGLGVHEIKKYDILIKLHSATISDAEESGCMYIFLNYPANYPMVRYKKFLQN